MFFRRARGFGSLVLGVRGRVVAVFAVTVGSLGSWAMAAVRLLTPSRDQGEEERHGTNTGLDPQPWKGRARRVRRHRLLVPTVVGVLLALSPVLGPIEQVSALFAEKTRGANSSEHRYRNALYYLLMTQTSCFRYWGTGVWTDYARELCRRATAILQHDF